MARDRKRRRLMSDINVVPYIDVMLVLLIIFMVTAPLLTQGVKVNLPKAAAKTMPPEKMDPVIVTVNHSGQYFLNINADPRAPISSGSLQQKVRSVMSATPNRKVYVRGDQSAEYGQVVQAMVLLQQAGVGSVGLVTDIMPTQRK
jgi:biopolymer transport protein TolR